MKKYSERQKKTVISPKNLKKKKKQKIVKIETFPQIKKVRQKPHEYYIQPKHSGHKTVDNNYWSHIKRYKKKRYRSLQNGEITKIGQDCM